MKKRNAWLLVGAALVLLGGIIFGATALIAKGDLTKMSISKCITNEYTVNEAFESVTLLTKDAKVEILPAKDGVCRVNCYEEESRRHTVTVKDGVLTVSVEDERKWYEYIGFHLTAPKVTVYLPEKEYASLRVENKTGDIQIRNLRAETLTVTTTTGKILLENVTCGGDITTNFLTGSTHFKNVTCGSLTAEGGTGSVTLESTLVRGKVTVETNTGAVKLLASDAEALEVKTNTGNVTGDLLSPKIFISKTNTGDIEAPETTTGGVCKITTNTGNIKITIK